MRSYSYISSNEEIALVYCHRLMQPETTLSSAEKNEYRVAANMLCIIDAYMHF
jgi:hypothetical protein